MDNEENRIAFIDESVIMLHISVCSSDAFEIYGRIFDNLFEAAR